MLQCKGKRHKESKPKTSVIYTAHIMAKNTDRHIKCAKRFISYNVMYTFHQHVNVCYGDDGDDDDDIEKQLATDLALNCQGSDIAHHGLKMGVCYMSNLIIYTESIKMTLIGPI